MKKSIAIVLIIVAVVLCTCPTLVFGVGAFYTSSSPEIMATMITNGQQVIGVNDSEPYNVDTQIAVNRIFGGCALCLGLVIPLAVGLITLRMARKKATQIN